MEEKLKQSEEERESVEEELQNRINELQQNLLKMNALEIEYTSLKATNNNITKELDDQKKHYTILKESIDELLTDKDKDIIDLRDSLSKVNDKINEIYSEYGKLQRERDFIQVEYNQITSRNYENEILELEERIEESENSRKSLQKEIEDAHKLWNIASENYEKTSIEEDRQKALAELEKKLKELLGKQQEYDKIKYENTELHIINDELKQAHEGQVLLLFNRFLLINIFRMNL